MKQKRWIMLLVSVILAVLSILGFVCAFYYRTKLWRVTQELHFEQSKLFEQEKHFKTMQEAAKDSFQAIASQALDKNNERFLHLAKERLEQKTIEANSQLDQKTLKFEQMVKPISDLLSKMESDFQRIERERGEQFGRLTEGLKSVSDISEQLRLETKTLTSALRRPEVRGSWGEMQLRRVVELAGMTSYCDFSEQVTGRLEDQLLKPDMVIHLPNNRQIIVDAKAVLDAYLDAIEAETEENRKVALIRHAKNLQSRVKDLAKKSYWDLFENSPDFVILFIPNEALLAAALEIDRNLIEDAMKDKIIIASPTTLVAVLKSIAYGWQQEKVHQNAQHILDTAKEFYDRLQPWLKNLDLLGGKLESAVKSYNDSMGSLESRVLPSARKIKDLGFQDRVDLPQLKGVEKTVRSTAFSESEN
ncbi:MAG: DNA recombination protein RmuC [Bdellovibrionales bacterium]|nr:DNA recombination protein RmuC [Bdellovibrionales bacterium]